MVWAKVSLSWRIRSKPCPWSSPRSATRSRPGRRSGIRILWCGSGSPQRSTSGANGSGGRRRPIRRLNELVRAIGAEERVPILPFHDTLEDPARPGRMRADWTSDGDHPSVAGYRRLGELAFRLP